MLDRPTFHLEQQAEWQMQLCASPFFAFFTKCGKFALFFLKKYWNSSQFYFRTSEFLTIVRFYWQFKRGVILTAFIVLQGLYLRPSVRHIVRRPTSAIIIIVVASRLNGLKYQSLNLHHTIQWYTHQNALNRGYHYLTYLSCRRSYIGQNKTYKSRNLSWKKNPHRVVAAHKADCQYARPAHERHERCRRYK